MTCRSDEYESQRLDAPNPVTPTKSLRNYWAGHDNTDAESSSADDEGENEEPVAHKKRTRVLAQYVLVKRLVTGELAEMNEEDIEK